MDQGDSKLNKEVFELLKTVSDGVRKYGLNNIQKIYDEVQQVGYNSFSREMSKAVVSAVISHYKIKKDRFFSKQQGKRYTSEIKARKMAFVLLKKFVNMSEYQIADYFNRNNALVYAALAEFKTLNPRVPADREFKEEHEAICLVLEKSYMELKIKYKLIEE